MLARQVVLTTFFLISVLSSTSAIAEIPFAQGLGVLCLLSGGVWERLG